MAHPANRPKGSFLTSIFGNKTNTASDESKNCLTKSQQHNGVTWVDVHDPTKDTLAKVAQQFNLQDIHVDQCLQKTQITQTDLTEDYIFLLFYFPYYVKEENYIANSQVNVFLGKDFIITVHDSANRQIVDQLFHEYQNNPVDVAKTPGKILYRFLNYLIKDTAELIQQILEEVEVVEDRVFAGNNGSEAQQIGQLRQKIIRLRRITTSQRTMLEDIGALVDKFTGERLAHYYANNTKTSHRLCENIEEAKDTIEIYKDADFITSTEKTNDILAVLTLLVTLTIPATVIGAIYGMNILLPGGIEAGSWTFWGEFTMLKLFILSSVLIALIMYLYFKVKKWF
jgi:magnesium transporter